VESNNYALTPGPFPDIRERGEKRGVVFGGGLEPFFYPKRTMQIVCRRGSFYAHNLHTTSIKSAQSFYILITENVEQLKRGHKVKRASDLSKHKCEQFSNVLKSIANRRLL